MYEFLDDAFARLPNFMMVGIVTTVVISRFHRPFGALLGILLWITVAGVGHHGYAQGHAVGFPGLPLSQNVFFGLCGVFIIMNFATGWAAWKRRKPEPEPEEEA